MFAIVIPVYRPYEKFTAKEIASIKRVIEIFPYYSIDFVGPQSLELTGLKQLLKGAGRNLNFIPFEDKYFTSLDGYNEFCMSKAFYATFKQYEYILLYQLDAYIFSDDLAYWCSLGYDLLGAPWLEGWIRPTLPIKFIGAGNGGLSLRKVSSFYKITHDNSYMRWVHLKQYIRTIEINQGWHRIPAIRKLLGPFTKISVQEDHFWAEDVPKKFPWFRVAPPEVAMKFSFEAGPEELYTLNNNQLPFGCHGWDKYGQEFWKDIIQY